MDAIKLLTTTRSVRKRLNFDKPVGPEVIRQCIDIAIQAPTGSNAQAWAFVVVTDAEKRARIGELYKDSFDQYASSGGQTRRLSENAEQNQRVAASARYLADNMYRVPVMIIPCYKGRVEEEGQMAQAAHYGSILPATWSLMLALRAHGLGSAWTTLHLRYADEIRQLLNIPPQMTQAALLPVAYYTGEDFQPAQRVSAENFTYWDTWGATTE